MENKNLKKHEKYALSDEDFLPVFEGETRFYGGNQNWFSDKFSVNGGCGVVAAANILAYMALRDEKCRGLYPFETLEKKSYTEFMTKMCSYVKIRSFFGQPIGVWGKSRLEKGVVSYAKERGCNLFPVVSRGEYSLLSVAEYIKEALAKDRPVAMLIGFNSKLDKIHFEHCGGGGYDHRFVRHWITITELCEEEDDFILKASSWGDFAHFSLKSFFEGESVYSAVVYFDIE